ncbi:MAG: lysylphosphatidylglycerol synthase domain-containing protein, partial [Acidobacteriota bacterium]
VPPISYLAGAVATGQTLNLLVPFRSGDVTRVLMIEGRKWTAAGTIAVEKAVDSAFFAAVCLTLPLVWVVPDSLEEPRVTAVAVSAVLLLAGFLVVPRLPRMGIRLTPRSFGILIASSSLIWSGSLLNNYLVLRFLNLDLPWIAPVVLLVILQVGTAVPSTPGKVGVFQALAVLGLSFFGVSSTPAIAFGLVLHALVLFPVAIMALIFWIFRTKWRTFKLRQSL